MVGIVEAARLRWRRWQAEPSTIAKGADDEPAGGLTDMQTSTDMQSHGRRMMCMLAQTQAHARTNNAHPHRRWRAHRTQFQNRSQSWPSSMTNGWDRRRRGRVRVGGGRRGQRTEGDGGCVGAPGGKRQHQVRRDAVLNRRHERRVLLRVHAAPSHPPLMPHRSGRRSETLTSVPQAFTPTWLQAMSSKGRDSSSAAF